MSSFCAFISSDNIYHVACLADVQPGLNDQ
jgi:hypothetical protein